MIDKFKSAFKEEADELLVQLENNLLELEDHPDDKELLNAAFRAVHTVKGSAAMFGFEEISRFTHDFENLLDACRNGKIGLSSRIIGLSLRARDNIKRMLAEGEQCRIDDASRAMMAEFVMEIKAGGAEGPAGDGSGASADPAPGEGPGNPAGEGEETAAPTGAGAKKTEGADKTFRISWKPGPGIFKSGTRVLKLLDELRDMGDCTVYPLTGSIPALGELNPESCYCAWDVILTTKREPNDIKDVFIFVESESELKVERINEIDRFTDQRKNKRLGEILVERGVVDAATMGNALKSQKKIGEVLVDRHIVAPGDLKSALAEQEHLKRVQEKQGEGIQASIRVASDKLDQLVDLVGELVTLEARLAQTSILLKEGSLASISEQFERLISQLRDNTMSMRMLPIGSTFNKFKRVVRDLSGDLGKEVDLVTEGAETELDKTVIEKLNDPLVHIIRNSLDHGIENPDERLAAGKSRRGSVKLSAVHSGAYVLIHVSDDGKGLNREAIRMKATEKGLIAPNQDLSEQELYQLIFLPGFSTAKNVTSVSGRGVGMDVVRREIDSLGGSVQISSNPGKGSVFTLKIPLTLAIIEGLLVKIGREFFVIPLSSIEGCIEIGRAEITGTDARSIIQYRNDLLPYVDLRTRFGVEGEAPAISQIVIVNTQEIRVGFVVDTVVGDYQTVIKPLGRMYKDSDGLSGATILGDGTVALIVDVNRIASGAYRERQRGAKAV